MVLNGYSCGETGRKDGVEHGGRTRGRRDRPKDQETVWFGKTRVSESNRGSTSGREGRNCCGR